jgi:hypothetical protein
MNYALLTNEELARYADLAANPLTTTELEQVLLARFTVLVGENAINAAAVEVLEEFNLDTSLTADIEAIRAALQFAQDYDLPTVRALMELASEHDIDTAALLKPRLELADQFDQIREDASDGIAVLNKIFNPTTA